MLIGTIPTELGNLVDVSCLLFVYLHLLPPPPSVTYPLLPMLYTFIGPIHSSPSTLRAVDSFWHSNCQTLVVLYNLGSVLLSVL